MDQSSRVAFPPSSSPPPTILYSTLLPESERGRFLRFALARCVQGGAPRRFTVFPRLRVLAARDRRNAAAHTVYTCTGRVCRFLYFFYIIYIIYLRAGLRLKTDRDRSIRLGRMPVEIKSRCSSARRRRNRASCITYYAAAAECRPWFFNTSSSYGFPLKIDVFKLIVSYWLFWRKELQDDLVYYSSINWRISQSRVSYSNFYFNYNCQITKNLV